MGTQQLLLIVLGVIIVGIAIAVGITIFNNQAYNANQQAVASELNTYASMVLQWWKTPLAQGGAGQGGTGAKLVAGDDVKIAAWVGFGTTATSVLTTDSGKYTLTSAAANGTTVVLTGCGMEKKGGVYPKVTTTLDVVSSVITAVVTTDDNGSPLD